MTTAGGISNLTSGAVPASPPPAHAAAPTSNAATTKPAASPSPEGISPRISIDPSAGVIIQYLSGTGQVELQIPSQTVVAYLKAGLTPEGLSKPQSNGSDQAASNSTLA